MRLPSWLSVTRRNLVTAALFCGYYAVSISLILFNKYVFSAPGGARSDHRGLGLPFPVVATAAHLLLNAALARAGIAALNLERPLAQLGHKGGAAPYPWRVLVRGVVPISLTMGVDIALSNMAFIYLSSSFVEMAKQSAILWTLVLTLAAGLRFFTPTLVTSVVVILAGQLLITNNEASFDAKGFVVVTIAAFASAVKNICIELLVAMRKTEEGDQAAVTAPLTEVEMAALPNGEKWEAARERPIAPPPPPTATTTRRNVGVLQALSLYLPLASAMLFVMTAVPYKECRRLCANYPTYCVDMPDPLGAKAWLAAYDESHTANRDRGARMRDKHIREMTWAQACAASIPAEAGMGTRRMLSEASLLWGATPARKLWELLGVMICGGLLAFLLHIFEVVLIGRASALAVSVLNVAKMAVLFVSAHAAFGETLEALQVAGFAITTAGLFLYLYDTKVSQVLAQQQRLQCGAEHVT